MSEVKRNCGRVTDRGEEACSEDCELMNKNRIRGDAEQGERANDRKALMVESSGGVYPAVVQSMIVFLPGETLHYS